MANHITQWKPQVTVNGQCTRFNTYAEVKRKMKSLLQESNNNEVSVSRSRRGEWGEWFEYWSLSNGQPVIKKQGWM
jgi:hypothetical protein